MTQKLKQIYDADTFRRQGHQLIDLIADYLQQAERKEIPVNAYVDPEAQYQKWKDYRLPDSDILGLFDQVIRDSIHLQHPHYMGHQVTVPAPVGALSGLVSDILNNGMGVYEMGGPANALERLSVEVIARGIGYNRKSGGVLTSGGTLANLTALLTARSRLADLKVWTEGNRDVQLAVMVSEQAHYCIDKAVRVMGMGSEGIITVPVNKRFQIRTELLDKYLEEARQKGKQVFAIVGSACSTSTGSYDDLEALSGFAERNGLWFHIDGAHGGAAVFSGKYRHLLKGIEKADSVIIDCHKMMLTPALATAVIYRRGEDSYATFMQKAQYLYEKEEQEWFMPVKRTFECTKFMMGLKFYSIILQHGTQAIDDFVTRLYDLSRIFADLIRAHPDLELAHEPEANIVCYRIIRKGEDEESLNQLNGKVRARILEEGKFYIVQTVLNGKTYLRNTFMNPFTTRDDMEALLEYLSETAEQLSN